MMMILLSQPHVDDVVVVAPASFCCHMMMILLSQPHVDDVVVVDDVSTSCYC
jgi:hypothetical protein